VKERDLPNNDYEFDSVMHIHEHACTPCMRDEAFTLSHMYAVHAHRFQHVWNVAHVRRTCTAYMYAVHVR